MSANEERTTLSGRLPEQLEDGAPAPIDPKTGKHKDYWILSDAERAKGFVRPVRESYVHVGIVGPQHPVRDLTDDERARFADLGYVKFETYPEGQRSTGRYWTQAQLDKVGKGCGVTTTMARKLAETYARQPSFYGATFCCGCGTHLPVGADGEFVWARGGERVGT